MRYEVKFLSTKKKKEWDFLLNNLPHKDIYFTPEYMQVFERTSERTKEVFGGEAKLFFYGNEENYIVYPFFKRDISTLRFYESFPTGDKLYDITSPYGFAGPLSKVTDKKSGDILWKKFLEEFHNHCLREDIVTEFARLNPFLKNHPPLMRFTGDVREFKDRIIYIDLTSDVETIWKNFKKSNRNAVNKAKREGVEVYMSKEQKGLDAFYELYNETMKLRDCKAEYFFLKEFYIDLFRSLKDNIQLFIAKYDDKVIAASLLLNKYNIAHYFLSGSDPRFLKKCPNNLLLYETILWAKEQGYRIFDLGGGYGIEDTLHKFKISFSKTALDFYTYNKIHNHRVYKLLCEARDKFSESEEEEIVKSVYFPGYRR